MSIVFRIVPFLLFQGSIILLPENSAQGREFKKIREKKRGRRKTGRKKGKKKRNKGKRGKKSEIKEKGNKKTIY